MSVKYHIKPDGNPGICKAVVSCRYGLDINSHYSSMKEAQIAYEKIRQNDVMQTLNKNEEKINVFDKGYIFDQESSKYGLTFDKPDIDGVFLEEIDGGEFYRFEQLEDIFYNFDENDVQLGYSLNANFKTLQKYLSDDIVNSYANVKNPFVKSLFSYDEDDLDNPSLTIVLVYKGDAYIIDGNHRFAAAKKKNMSAFAGVVIGTNDSMERMWLISPEKFNRTFSH